MALERKVKLLFNNNREDLKFKLNTPLYIQIQNGNKKKKKKETKKNILVFCWFNIHKNYISGPGWTWNDILVVQETTGPFDG